MSINNKFHVTNRKNYIIIWILHSRIEKKFSNVVCCNEKIITKLLQSQINGVLHFFENVTYDRLCALTELKL